MKTKNFFVIMMASAAVLFTSCKQTEPESVTVTLDQTEVEVAVGASVKLTATVTPAGNEVTWSSENTEIAIVTNGTVVGKAEGTTNIVATSGDAKATCAVTVTAGSSGSVDFSKIACLQGSNYFPIVLSQGARDYLGSKVIQDLGPNGDGTKDANGKLVNSQNLWFWDGTVGVGTADGTNSFGEMDGYLCLTRTNPDWGGAGYAIAPPADCPTVQTINMSDIYAHPDQYYFHVAFKVTDPSFSVTLGFGDGIQNGKKEVKFTFGSVPGDGSQTPRAAIPKDGIWHEFEIPCTEFVKGDAMLYQNPFYDSNIMFMLLYPSQGVTLHMDAAFFYKK